MMKERIVVLGFMSHFPVAGVAWQTMHYLLGFERLGYDVFYVECHGCPPTKHMTSKTDDGALKAATYLDSIMRRFDMGNRWAYESAVESRSFGMSSTQRRELFRSAAAIINLHGSHLPTPELTATNRLIYLETDPVDVEIDLHQKKQSTIDYLQPHAAFFTFGEQIGKPGCLVPPPDNFHFEPTRQPVVIDFWNDHADADTGVFTTIGNWRQPWREIEFDGDIYRWSKHFEFNKFIDLPQRVQQPFELSLSRSSCNDAEKQMLESKGWRVRDALILSEDLERYRSYVRSSRGEFTVAKDQNVRLLSGWFSDRSATYLAAGRPVITQETGFSNIFPVGEGLFAFSTLEDIMASIESIQADYQRHRRAAFEIAREYFSHDVVLKRLLSKLGITIRKTSAASEQAPLLQPRQRRRNLATAGRPWITVSALTSRVAAKESFAAARLVHRRNSIHGLRPWLSSDAANGAKTGCDKSPAQNPSPSCLPSDLVIVPTSRWPTRLRQDTLDTALQLATPVASETKNRRKTASIIIVTYNGLPYTKMCLASLFAHEWHAGDEIIIIDNGSTDGTDHFLRGLSRLNGFVRYEINKTNRGFAEANNQGLGLARSEILVLLNNDTIVPRGWLDGLERWLEDPATGTVGPVTNRTCNEAQIDAPYRTFGEMEYFAREYTRKHSRQAAEIPMLAMFCMAMRRDVFESVGFLDAQFQIGMFEDDDYAQRVRLAGYKIICAEDVFVHHFGQAALGELCIEGQYDRLYEANRRRYEAKWNIDWKPHGRRITPEYECLRTAIRDVASQQLPSGATILIMTKGDEELLNLRGHRGWHFPRDEQGRYPNIYPADSAEAITQLETGRAQGAEFLLVPKPAFWWLDFYSGFRDHLDRYYRLTVREEESCFIFDIRGER